MENNSSNKEPNPVLPESINELTAKVSDTLKLGYDQLMDLSKRRAEEKLSSNGTTNIAKELRELMKIVERYCN